MEKKLSKKEEIAKLCTLVSNSANLSDNEWDFIYDMIREYPDDVRSLLKYHYATFYHDYFRSYFALRDNDPDQFNKYQYIPQLIGRQPIAKIEIIDSDLYGMPPNVFAKGVFRLNIRYNSSFRFEVELNAHASSMVLRTSSPLEGVVSRSVHVPHFTNPIARGFIRPNCVLRQRGYYRLLSMIDEAYGIMQFIMKYPSTALGLYTIVYEEAKSGDEKIEYGKIQANLINYYEIVNWTHKVAKKKFHHAIQFPPDLIESIQNVLTNHQEIFKNPFN